MKRFVKEYASYKLADYPFCSGSLCARLYADRIENAVRNCVLGLVSVNEAMQMIAYAEEYAMREGKED